MENSEEVVIFKGDKNASLIVSRGVKIPFVMFEIQSKTTESELRLTHEFFDACKAHIPGGKRALQKEPAAALVWDEEWQLFVPNSLQSIVDKGVNESDGI